MAKKVEMQRRYALVGARFRLEQLEAEREELFATFPELRTPATVSPAEIDSLIRVSKARTKRIKRMSAELRKATGERMRKYWAERRGEEATKPGAIWPLPKTRVGNRTVVDEAKLTPEQRKAWLQKKKLDAIRYARVSKGQTHQLKSGPAVKKKYKMSAATRRKMSAATKARWAKAKAKAKGGPVANPGSETAQ